MVDVGRCLQICAPVGNANGVVADRLVLPAIATGSADRQSPALGWAALFRTLVLDIVQVPTDARLCQYRQAHFRLGLWPLVQFNRNEHAIPFQ